MRLSLLAGVLCIGAALSAADSDLLHLAMPDAETLADVNVDRFVDSPGGHYLLNLLHQYQATMMDALVTQVGFDMQRDLREILVSGRGQPGHGRALMIFRGKFDTGRILQKQAEVSPTRVQTYNGVPVVETANRQKIALLDSTLILLGDPEEVAAAIDRWKAKAQASPPQSPEALRLGSLHDVWFVTTMELAKVKLPNSGPPNSMAAYADVKQVSGGAKLGETVVLTFELTSRTTQSATMFAAGLRMAGPMLAATDNPQYKKIGEFFKKVQVSADGLVTRAVWNLPEADLEAMIEAALPKQTKPMPAKLLRQTAPVYPPLAKEARVSGVVKFDAVIGTDGKVESLKIVSGHPLLVQSAMDAAKQWVYEPVVTDGKPAKIVTQIEVNFSLDPVK